MSAIPMISVLMTIFKVVVVGSAIIVVTIDAVGILSGVVSVCWCDHGQMKIGKKRRGG